MTKSVKSKIYQTMCEILPRHPSGLRAKKLKEYIVATMSLNENTVRQQISKIVDTHTNEFSKEKVKDGGTVYFSVDVIGEGDNIATQTTQYKEEDFYDSFAKYLQYGDNNDEKVYLGECTKAIKLGGSITQRTWETPDVIGVLRAKHTAPVKFPDEIVSAEIKIDKTNRTIIMAFGQACAFRLFSHKVYLVVPKPEDYNRVEKLCQIFGIGLVYFDPDQEPDVSIYNLILPAQKHSPDMFYVNNIVSGKIADKLYK